MYSDINNPVLKLAIDQDPTLASKLNGNEDNGEEGKINDSKICTLYIYNDWTDENLKMKVFSLQKGNPF